MKSPLRIAPDYVPCRVNTPVFAHGLLWQIGNRANKAPQPEEPMTQERLAEAWGMNQTAVAQMKMKYPHKYRYLIRYGKGHYDSYRHRITERIEALAWHIPRIYDAYRYIEHTEGVPHTTTYNIIKRAKRGSPPIKHSTLLIARKVLRALERYTSSWEQEVKVKSMERYTHYLKHMGVIA